MADQVSAFTAQPQALPSPSSTVESPDALSVTTTPVINAASAAQDGTVFQVELTPSLTSDASVKDVASTDSILELLDFSDQPIGTIVDTVPSAESTENARSSRTGEMRSTDLITDDPIVEMPDASTTLKQITAQDCPATDDEMSMTPIVNSASIYSNNEDDDTMAVTLVGNPKASVTSQSTTGAIEKQDHNDTSAASVSAAATQPTSNSYPMANGNGAMRQSPATAILTPSMARQITPFTIRHTNQQHLAADSSALTLNASEVTTVTPLTRLQAFAELLAQPTISTGGNPQAVQRSKWAETSASLPRTRLDSQLQSPHHTTHLPKPRVNFSQPAVERHEWTQARKEALEEAIRKRKRIKTEAAKVPTAIGQPATATKIEAPTSANSPASCSVIEAFEKMMNLGNSPVQTSSSEDISSSLAGHVTTPASSTSKTLLSPALSVSMPIEAEPRAIAKPYSNMTRARTPLAASANPGSLASVSSARSSDLLTSRQSAAHPSTLLSNTSSPNGPSSARVVKLEDQVLTDVPTIVDTKAAENLAPVPKPDLLTVSVGLSSVVGQGKVPQAPPPSSTGPKQSTTAQAQSVAATSTIVQPIKRRRKLVTVKIVGDATPLSLPASSQTAAVGADSAGVSRPSHSIAASEGLNQQTRLLTDRSQTSPQPILPGHIIPEPTEPAIAETGFSSQPLQAGLSQLTQHATTVRAAHARTASFASSLTPLVQGVQKLSLISPSMSPVAGSPSLGAPMSGSVQTMSSRATASIASTARSSPRSGHVDVARTDPSTKTQPPPGASAILGQRPAPQAALAGLATTFDPAAFSAVRKVAEKLNPSSSMSPNTNTRTHNPNIKHAETSGNLENKVYFEAWSKPADRGIARKCVEYYSFSNLAKHQKQHNLAQLSFRIFH
jgi:hypothetical protein